MTLLHDPHHDGSPMYVADEAPAPGSEVLVRLHWDGVEVRNRPTRVTYPSDGVSHFDLWRDNLRISRMHARLFFGMLWRLPRLLARKRRRA